MSFSGKNARDNQMFEIKLKQACISSKGLL